jgi:HD-like signal output (HDOD) protein
MSEESLEESIRHITRRKWNFPAATAASIRSLQDRLVEEQHLQIIRQHARGSSVY